MTTTIEELEGLFDDHPSLDASLQDFEHPLGNSEQPAHHYQHPRRQQTLSSPRQHFGYPSHHSGFRSEDSESDLDVSIGRFSPPAWRRDGDGKRSNGFWSGSLHASRRSMLGKEESSGRESSMEYQSADEGDDRDITLAQAARTRLPRSASPEKRRSPSPDLYPSGGGDFGKTFGGKVKEEEADAVVLPPLLDNPNNFIRFAVRAEVQHRTEPFEAAFCYLRTRFDKLTRSWTSVFTSILVAVLVTTALRSLFQPGTPLPVPDLVKVAGLAKAFEPLIFYSENGVAQIGDLQATGVAVWDLGESVRNTNMTSAPIIVRELDELSDSLKTLAIELTRFFANVDGDVDGILIVMEWAKRELAQLTSTTPSPISSAFDNVHTVLSRVGILETRSGEPTSVGALTTSLFGLTSSQRTRQTLQRTFTEFLTVLEDSIASELQHSLALFALFESIDRQFLNLARTVIRETTAQESAQDDLLSSLWTRILGPDSSTLSKFERNKKLLSNIRAKTVQNKSILLEHNGKLLTLKANLESLRRKLVSPLLRANASTLGLEDQIRGLDEVGGHLSGVREKQKSKLMEMLYGAGSHGGRRVVLADRGEIDARWE